jgi:hypothetical protein
VQHIHPAPRAEQPVDPGHALDHFGAVALHQTARRHQHLMLAFAPPQFLEYADRFFLRRLQKAAGVDDEHIGVLLAVGRPVIGIAQQHFDAVAVDFIFGAAQRNQVILHNRSSLSH